MSLDKVVERACRELPAGQSHFTAGEISAALKKLADENSIMLTDNIVFPI